MSDRDEKAAGASGDVPALLKYILGGVGGAALAAGGGLWINYSDFRKTRAEANSSSVEHTIEASDKLRPILDRYTKIALGKAEPSAKDNELLRSVLRDALEKAEDTKNRWHGLDKQFINYANSLTGLYDGASNMTGPLDAKQYVKAHATYIVADQNWRQAVQAKQNSYLSYLW